MNNREVLLSHLLKSGIINAEFWLKELEKLGIKSLANLEGNKSILPQLEKREEFAMNKEAFEKLLALGDEKSTTVLQKTIVNFESFDKLLRQILQNGSSSSESYQSQISKAIHDLSSHYRGTYDEVFISILVHHFQSTNIGAVFSLRPLLLKDVEYLSVLFSEQRSQFMKYAKMHCQQLQAYLLNLAICMDQNSEDLVQKTAESMKLVKPPLQKELLQHVNEYQLGSTTVKEFKQSLDHLIKPSSPISKELLPNNNCNSLNFLLRQRIYPFEVAFQAQQQLSLSEKNPDAYSLLEQTGLSDYYPNGLHLKDALCICPDTLRLSLGKTSLTNVKQLPQLILQKLMSYDSLCRSEFHLCTESSNQCISSGSEDDDYEDSDEEDSCQVGIHPVDALLAIILCSDHFLCQDLFSRLAKCQLAVPFLLPDPFTKQLTLPLWSMRSIIKDWKCTKEDGTVDQQTQPIIAYRMPLVSFVRLGEHQKRGASKSKILNDVINDSNYNHFFHRDCPGGQHKLILGEGLADMCWYLPAGKPTDAFPDAVTFLNLHGDVRQHFKQSRFLSKISSMCFILISEELQEIDSQTAEILQQFSSSPGGVTLLNDVENKPKVLKKEIPKAHVINLTKKNGAEIKSAIQLRIRKKLYQVKDFQSIEELCRSRQEDEILVDEDTDNYMEGQLRASKIMSIITSKRAECSMKRALLPLQGEGLWKAWATCDKEIYRQINRGNKLVTDYTDSIECEKKSIRMKQLSHIESLTPMMQLFIESLLTLGGSFNRTVRNYFLQSLKIQLNDLSRESVSGLQYKYQAVRKALSLLNSQNESEVTSSKKVMLTKELHELQENIINSSLGLEHLLRELGQVYEAAVESHTLEDNLSHLPHAAAELLIDGYPLELMDGDAAHVPLQWVTAVLKEAANMLDDPKIFVLSVVGLQSTGKSTMLNTVFGLQFNVSAGRCTRGAFMQLLPVNKELQQLTRCSYVLIVDTEGLRAPELDPLKTQKHDNELATFVIGLANMTFINIYGEVPGDMDDILQTSVHAFIRMSLIKYSPSCQFVHQNAGANISSEVGRAKFTQKLNQFTLDAAKEENCEEQFKSFNDVIKFDDQTDVHCFPGLWSGDPPMAPVNNGYSNASQMLKEHFINVMCKRLLADISVSSTSNTGCLTLSSFKVNLTDLWEALLKENFVFSFKNTLEITAYNSLEAAYGNWDWTLQEAMLTWEHKTENEFSRADAKDVQSLVNKKRKDLQDVLSKLHETIKLEMEEFFNGKQSEILVQWKAKFETKLDGFVTDLRVHAENHCKELARNKTTFSKLDEEKKNYESNVTKNVQKIIESIRQEQEMLNEHLEEKKLDSSELKKILERKLFVPQNLTIFKEQKLINDDQEKKINAIIDRYEGQLTESALEEILVGKVFSAKEVQDIIKMARQTDEELEAQFNDIWKEILDDLPSPMKVDFETVEEKVEATLIEFVRSKRHEGELINILQKRRLTTWGERLHLVPEERHFTKITSIIGTVQKLSRKLQGSTDPAQIEAIGITERIFRVADKYLDAVSKKNTDFNVAFTKELLRLVDEKITEESLVVKQSFKFTVQYRLEVFLMVCGHGIPIFKRMAEVFEERNDPRLHLEREVRSTLLTQYKNQYNQIQAEEGIAAIICASFEKLIENEVRLKLGQTMVTEMNYINYFTCKRALKVKVLTDIYGSYREFEDYMAYVRNSSRCLQTHIRRYAEQFCNQSYGEITKLQQVARKEASKKITVIKDEVDKINDKDAKTWLSKFCENEELIRETGLSLKAENVKKGYESLKVFNLENFKSKIEAGLDQLKKKLHSSLNHIRYDDIVHKPHDLLSVIGCTEQCPFCGEQCDHARGHCREHTTGVHRPSCLAGWRWDDSNRMVIDFCQNSVAGNGKFHNPLNNYKLHPYSDYKSVYRDWSITPNSSSEGCLFWKWFVKKYNGRIASEFGAQPANCFRLLFFFYEWEEIESDLRKVYNL